MNKIANHFSIVIIFAVLCMWLWIYLNTYGDGDHYVRNKYITYSRISDILSALGGYYNEYGRYPVDCQSIEALVTVLTGGEDNVENPRQINFMHLKNGRKISKLYCVDGFGKDFKLIRSQDGTNLIIRSLGRNGTDDNGKLDDRDGNTKDVQLHQQAKDGNHATVHKQ